MEVQEGLIRVEYTGDRIGAVPHRLPNGQTVRLANTASNRYADIPAQFYEHLASREPIRKVQAPAPFVAPPTPLPEPEADAVAVNAEPDVVTEPSIPRRKGRTVKDADAE